MGSNPFLWFLPIQTSKIGNGIDFVHRPIQEDEYESITKNTSSNRESAKTQNVI